MDIFIETHRSLFRLKVTIGAMIKLGSFFHLTSQQGRPEMGGPLKRPVYKLPSKWGKIFGFHKNDHKKARLAAKCITRYEVRLGGDA
jgi:hypothetical protein